MGNALEKLLDKAADQPSDPMIELASIAAVNSNEEIQELQRILEEISANKKLSSLVRYKLWGFVFEISTDVSRGLGLANPAPPVPEKINLLKVSVNRFRQLINSGVVLQVKSPTDGDWLDVPNAVFPPDGTLIRFMGSDSVSPMEIIDGAPDYRFLAVKEEIIFLEPQYPE